MTTALSGVFSAWYGWERTFSDADEASRTYFVDGAFDGGAGKDTFTFDFRESYFYHAWGGNTWDQSESPSWHLDLSRASWSGVEALEFTTSGYGPALGASEFGCVVGCTGCGLNVDERLAAGCFGWWRHD